MVSCSFCYTHTYTTTFSGTEDLSTLECCHGLGHIDEDIAAVLHQVLLFLTEVTLTGTVYLLYGIQRIIGLVRTEVDKCII